MRLRLVVLGMLPPLALCAGGMFASAAESPAGTTPPAQEGQASPQPPAGASAPAVGGTMVIRPPAGIDPGINMTPPDPAPEAGRMPIVPPPGAPGGNPAVVPK